MNRTGPGPEGGNTEPVYKYSSGTKPFYIDNLSFLQRRK